jgi:hypothetical protein
MDQEMAKRKHSLSPVLLRAPPTNVPEGGEQEMRAMYLSWPEGQALHVSIMNRKLTELIGDPATGVPRKSRQKIHAESWADEPSNHYAIQPLRALRINRKPTQQHLGSLGGSLTGCTKTVWTGNPCYILHRWEMRAEINTHVLCTSDEDKYTMSRSHFLMTENEKEDSFPPSLFTESEAQSRFVPVQPRYIILVSKHSGHFRITYCLFRCLLILAVCQIQAKSLLYFNPRILMKHSWLHCSNERFLKLPLQAGNECWHRSHL